MFRLVYISIHAPAQGATLMAGDVVWDEATKKDIFFKTTRQLEKWEKKAR